jgi:hypothetical protein
MKKILFLAVFCSTMSIYAQEETTDYEMRAGEKYGYIIDKGGKKIEGIVRLAGDDMSPWTNQKKVKFIASSDIDSSKKKQKFKTYDVDDLKGYMAIDNDTERVFENIKYTNVKEAYNTQNGGLSGNLKAFNNLTKSNQFAELVSDGKIKVYKVYGFPTTFSAGGQIAVADAENKRMRENPSYVYSKKGGKPEELTLAKAKIITADCPVVKGKMTKGEYSSLKNDTKQRSGLGKFIRNEIGNAMADNKAIVDEVIVDYNENCK